MFTRRSFLSAAGALAVAATLAACGSDDAGDGGALSKDTKARADPSLLGQEPDPHGPGWG